MDSRILWISGERFLEVRNRLVPALAGAFPDRVQAQKVLVVALGIHRSSRGSAGARRQQLNRKRTDQMVGDLSLDVQYVGDGPLVGFGPQLRLFRCIHQLRDDPDAVSGAADTPIEQIVDAELLADLSRGRLRLLVPDG